MITGAINMIDVFETIRIFAEAEADDVFDIERELLDDGTSTVTIRIFSGDSTDKFFVAFDADGEVVLVSSDLYGFSFYTSDDIEIEFPDFSDYIETVG